jgi:hypothetical protein
MYEIKKSILCLIVAFIAFVSFTKQLNRSRSDSYNNDSNGHIYSLENDYLKYIHLIYLVILKFIFLITSETTNDMYTTRDLDNILTNTYGLKRIRHYEVSHAFCHRCRPRFRIIDLRWNGPQFRLPPNSYCVKSLKSKPQFYHLNCIFVKPRLISGWQQDVSKNNSFVVIKIFCT